MEAYLTDLYYDPSHPAAFGGVGAIQHSAKRDGKHVTAREIKTWLRERDTYTLHKPVQRHFKRNRVIVSGIDSQWQADLVDMASFAKQNKGFRYILTCIDIFFKICMGKNVKR